MVYLTNGNVNHLFPVAQREILTLVMNLCEPAKKEKMRSHIRTNCAMTMVLLFIFGTEVLMVG
jgi:hypothetical protein